MLTENQVKEQLCISYVNAVAAMCNFGCEFTRIDMDSIDVTITCNGNLSEESTIRSPEVKLQLKATENLNLNEEDNFSFPLPIKNYNDLRANTLAPRILVILKLPNDQAQWLNHSVSELIMKECAYWINLKGLPESSNELTVTVYLSKLNIFSPDTLKTIMLKISKEESV